MARGVTASGENPGAPPEVRLNGWHWSDFYSLCLFLLIPCYYALVLAALISSLERAFFRWPWTLQPGWPANFVLAILWLTLAIRLSFYLFRGVRGLVTPSQYDDVRPDGGVMLDRQNYPQLFEAIDEVGKRVRGPVPDEVWITARPECYAAELRWFAFTTRRRLILVLGLPHLAVLSIAELKVILAHELAHFGGGDTRLGVFLFRFVKSLEASLERAAPRWWRWIDPVFWISLVGYVVFHFLVAPVSRYREIRADSWSAAAYGGELAARTLLEEWQLGYQFDAAVVSYDRNGMLASDPPLVDSEQLVRRKNFQGSRQIDVYSWFATHWREFSKDGFEYLERRLAEEERPSFWDSHPTMQTRLRVMRRFQGNNGQESPPARTFVPDFGELGRQLQGQIFP